MSFRTINRTTNIWRARGWCFIYYGLSQGLLELGSLPNYKDAKGLTPLYYSVTHAKDPSLCELLLHNYAVLGAVDSQGWQEIHQVMRPYCHESH